MADDRIDQEQTQQISDLDERLTGLEMALAASPVTAMAVRELFPSVEPLAWPAGVADGQVITAAYINSISDSVHIWPAEVDANSQILQRAGKIAIGMIGPTALLHILGQNVGGIDSITAIQLDRGYDAVGDSIDIAWGPGPNYMGRLAVSAVGGGEAGFTFYAQSNSLGYINGFNNAVMRIDGLGAYYLYRLRSTNPGAGSKALWYDPADGNRVKFAP